MNDTLESLKEVIKRVRNLVRKTSMTPNGMEVLGINGRFIDFNVSGVTVGWRVYESGGDEVREAVGRAILKNPAWDMAVEIMMRNVLGGREARIKSISSRLLKMGQRRGIMRRGTKTEVARELISSDRLAGTGAPEAVQSLRHCSETLHGEIRKYGSAGNRATMGIREAGVLRQVAT